MQPSGSSDPVTPEVALLRLPLVRHGLLGDKREPVAGSIAFSGVER